MEIRWKKTENKKFCLAKQNWNKISYSIKKLLKLGLNKNKNEAINKIKIKKQLKLIQKDKSTYKYWNLNKKINKTGNMKNN